MFSDHVEGEMYRFREPVNGFTHLAGALLAIGGLIWLVMVAHQDAVELLTVVIYGVCTILLYIASAAYHLAHGSDYKLLWLRRFDHAAIYLMIAGTYTPIVYNALDGYWRWGILLIVWGMAALGVVYKLLFFHRGGLLSLLYYVAMGGLGVIVAPQLVNSVSPAVIVLLAMGGVCFLTGAIIFGIERPNLHRHFGHHELWHLLVLGGSVFHFAAIVRVIA
jgi:hemolysin III